jgi:hypothetical protein
VLVRLAAAVALAVSTVACGGGDGNGEETRTDTTPQAYTDGPPDTRAIRFAPAPTRVVAECRRAANHIGAPFPCPRELPRATRASAPDTPVPAPRVELVHQGSGTVSGLSIEYGAPPFEGEPPPGVEMPPSEPWQIRPCCFFHATIELLRSRPGFPAQATSIAGRGGFLSTELGPRFTMYQDHTQFMFPSNGRWCLITVHTAGTASATRLLLDRLVANLDLIEPSR